MFSKYKNFMQEYISLNTIDWDIITNLPTLKPLQTPKYIDLVSKK
jgi:hypothetical protein